MKRNAFTLVELLIVVIILGILAAVVIPQFTDASTDAQTSSLTTNLSIIRGQLELYKLQHSATWPTLASFTAQMTAQTNISGGVGTDYGPYLQSVPNNPFTNSSDLAVTGLDTSAWYYNETTGEFRANSTGQETF